MTATPTPGPATSPSESSADRGADAGEHEPAGTLAVANAALRGGFVLLPRPLLRAPGLSRDAKLLYAVLLSYAWQQGSCFPGYERLQHDLQCSVNSVTKWIQELEGAGLVTRRKRGQGKTTLYTLHDPSAPPPGLGADTAGQTHSSWDSGRRGARQTPKICESALPKPAALEPRTLRPEYHPEGEEAEEQQPAAQAGAPGPVPRPGTVAHATSDGGSASGAGDDDALVGLLISRGITQRIAGGLVRSYPEETIRQQVAWQAYRPAAKSPAGALVQAIRDAWPPPQAWVEAQEHAAAVARQAEEERRRREEDEARRRAWAAKPPEERIAGRLQFWVMGQRAKGHEPTATEIAARRAELLAELSAAPAASTAVG